jgi:release factor glutamine methyltransferase
MSTGTQLLVWASKLLRAAQVDEPAVDARILLAFALGIERSRLTLVLPDEVAAPSQDAFKRAIEARVDRQPVAQIIGKRAFYGRDFIVTGDVLDPRPDTELLVEKALQHPFESVLDLGTGSGCIILTLLAETLRATGVGGDVSSAALKVARRNAQAFDLEGRVEFFEGSWFDPLSGGAQFDLIVSNPPYISDVEMASLAPEVQKWEPHLALTPGGDGLDCYREIAKNASGFLAPKGRLIVEIGAAQGGAVKSLFLGAGYSQVQVLKDLSGYDRVVCGVLSKG